MTSQARYPDYLQFGDLPELDKTKTQLHRTRLCIFKPTITHINLTLYYSTVTMCKKATCGTCNKTSWWGCGSHISSVLDSVPAAERCECEPKIEVGGTSYPPMAASPN
ncbi:hypothetical protein CEP51_006509 [Fusarium floridanum]|uniref:Uncharacterized protein n=1 Tax=Fusarium floridanum TaxID=1325733 RepID=A0A428RSR0_9HYPO|nr:hypothetical protein CEP51_006509 [Fusarium floridanum]